VTRPHVQFNVRMMMGMVAVAALVMGAMVEYARLGRMSAAFRDRAVEHAAIEETLRRIIAASGADAPVDISPGLGARSIRFTARAVAEHEVALRTKYERASRYPWLPVEPDSIFPR
jgi:hypothetical protein